nr:hypothetical protein GCM10020185_17670 [Pseudomonas brassicacearum subsp. brassicacearum]
MTRAIHELPTINLRRLTLAYDKTLYSFCLCPTGSVMSLTAKPLAGVKVIELGTLIAGPFASRICGEFGAEVIKVESPDGGDPLRKWRKLYEGTSLWWFVQARNKKSLTLNLKHPEGLAILKKTDWRSRYPDREFPPRRTGKSSAWAGMYCTH